MKYSAVWRKISGAFWNDQAHIFGLYSIGFGYPYITVLGNNPAFMIAHEATPLTSLLTAIILVSAIPVVFVGIRYLVRRLCPRRLRTFDLLFCVLMLLPANLYCVSRHLIHAVFPENLELYAYWLICLAGTAALTALYLWKKTTDLFRIAAVLPPIYLIYLIFFSPSSALFGHGKNRPGKKEPTATAAIVNPVPIVIVIMDEFSLSAILDRNWKIDRERFPHLAAFADTSCWFPKARSVAAYTVNAVPVIATGRAVQINPRNEAPRVQYVPNLFTWLQPQYHHFNIRQWTPYLADPEITSKGFRARELAADLLAFSYYFFFYSFAEHEIDLRMPPQWKGFGYTIVPGLKSWLRDCRGGKTLNFFHLMRPHIPLVNLPDGTAYENSGNPVGDFLPHSTRENNHCLLNLSYHQYLLQCGYVDTIIGEIVRHLKRKGIFDDAVIVLTADHGICYAPGSIYRGTAGPAGLAEVGFIPLMIKRPHQTVGEVSDRQATTLDIMPTIGAILRTPLPWKADGHDLFAPDFPVFDYDLASKRIMYNRGFKLFPQPDYRSYTLNAVTATQRRRLETKAILFNDHLPLGETRANYTEEKRFNRLLGRPTSSFTVRTLQGATVSAYISSATFVSANLDEVPEKFARRPLAIGLNGVIDIVTRPASWDGFPRFFGGMFPQKNATPATLEYYLIDEEHGQTVLYRIEKVRYRNRPMLKGIACPLSV